MSEKKKEEPKFIEEKTITYRGFKDAEEAKKFLNGMRDEIAETWRSFDRFFEGTRDFIDVFFRPYSVNDEIEYHRQQLKRLEKKKVKEEKEE